jgi:hypothetical protein
MCGPGVIRKNMCGAGRQWSHRLAVRKSALTLTAGFGLVALGLATLGIYRVLSEQWDWTKRE